nr:DUF3519 domain-containing protein [Helicobacter pylori]
MLITQDNDTILRTFITDTPKRYVRNHVRNVDIIHSFIQPNRTAKSDNALSDVVVYGENATKKPLTSQEDLLKTQENPLKNTQAPLSPLEQANAEKLAKLESEKLESEKEFSRLKEQEQARKAALKKDKEAFLKDLNAIKPTPLPKEIDTDSFLNAFNGVSNKENFIKHLKNKPDSKHRLAYLNLVEPTLKEPDITLIFKDQGKEVKKEHIKAFQGDPKTIYYFLVTQDNDSKLITGLKVKPIYIKAEIDKADIIHSFIPQARTLKE